MAAIVFVIAIIAAIFRSGGFAHRRRRDREGVVFRIYPLVTSLIKGIMRAGRYSALARLSGP
jgi:hypothetical protein